MGGSLTSIFRQPPEQHSGSPFLSSVDSALCLREEAIILLHAVVQKLTELGKFSRHVEMIRPVRMLASLLHRSPRSLELADRLLAPAQQCVQFGTFGFTPLHAVLYIQRCLVVLTRKGSGPIIRKRKERSCA